jgi:cobalt-zinc-cadmium efflux system protein
MSDHHHHNHNGHNHSHSHSHAHDHAQLGNIRAALIINTCFAVIELAGGILANSFAVMANAIHDLGDTLSLILTYFSEKYATKKIQNREYTFGNSRLPLVSAFINSVILLASSLIIVATAIPHLFHPNQPDENKMLIVAVIGFLANGSAFYRMMRNDGLNSRVMRLHLLEDVLGWVSVIVVSVVLRFVNLPVLDPILSIAIAVFILTNVFKNIRAAVQLFLQRSPADINVEEVEEYLEGIPQVEHVHDLHIWSLEGMHHVMSAHIELKENLDAEKSFELKEKIREGIRKFGELHATIELEFPNQVCVDRC